MKTILAELLTIGDEILYGQIVDTNSQWMSVELDRVGIKVIRKTTVGDREDEILKALAEAESRADIILNAYLSWQGNYCALCLIC